MIEVLILRALASYARDDVPTALAHLDRAVRLAEPEGQVYAFARHGRHLSPLMESLVHSPAAVRYTHVLLAACIDREAGTRAERGLEPPNQAGSSGLAEQLSARELEVLHLLDTELDGPEIAQRMFVSINTLRTHTKSIYSKLGVNNRHAAVRRGRELELGIGP